MRLLFAGSVRKDPLAPDARNEDAFAYDEKRGLYAVSDGASESYNSALWSRILVRRYMQWNGRFRVEDLQKCIDIYSKLQPVDQLSWSQALAFERGSFATFLALQFLPRAPVARVTCCGDSLLVVLDQDRPVFTYPYQRAKDFLKRPNLLSTQSQHNRFLSQSEGRSEFSRIIQFSMLRRPRFLLMTDAIGQWFLNQFETGGDWRGLLTIWDQAGFSEWVRAKRSLGLSNGGMRVDDSTLIVIGGQP